MSGIDLALGDVGAVAAVDVAIKACKRVVETCNSSKCAETEIHERSIRLSTNCLQVGAQLEHLHQIGDHLDEQRQTVQRDVLKILVQKIDHADTILKSLAESRSAMLNPNSPQGCALSKWVKTNYARQKSSLDMAIAEIESWQRVSFNPIWFATMKLQTQQFDKVLHQVKESGQSQQNEVIETMMTVRNPLMDVGSVCVFLPPETLELAKFAEIPYSSVKAVKISSPWRLLDSVPGLSKDAVRNLAARLKLASPSMFSLLTCLGAFQHWNNTFSIIFQIPDGMREPETLRAKIMSGDTSHSLSERFQLATQLARAVFSIHTFDMVHKSIRPENIILFRDSDSTFGSTFLLGFDIARREEGCTRLFGDTDWAKNLYRHPQRQGSRLQDRYIVQHDIYSLGVCMLEIGLWNSLVTYDLGQTQTRSQTYNLGATSSSQIESPDFVRSRLISLATMELPGKMAPSMLGLCSLALLVWTWGTMASVEHPRLQKTESMLLSYILREYALTVSEDYSVN